MNIRYSFLPGLGRARRRASSGILNFGRSGAKIVRLGFVRGLWYTRYLVPVHMNSTIPFMFGIYSMVGI